MSKKTITTDQIDDLLPQTQCGLCTYNGCRPYAEAIVHQDEAINLCLPGGVDVLQALGDVTGQASTPYIEEMFAKQKPAQTVVIREDECIGCTKCIQACPVDAIIGAAKLMHSVITDECSGCELCIEPCPVDCIDIIPVAKPDKTATKRLADQYRQRYQQREARLLKQKLQKLQRHQQAKKTADSNQRLTTVEARKAEIAAAIARVKSKKKPRTPHS